MTVKHTLVSLDMRVFALCSLMELHRCKITSFDLASSHEQNSKRVVIAMVPGHG